MVCIAITYSDELTVKFKSKFDTSLFSNVRVTEPHSWCYNMNCKHSHVDYDSSGQPDRNSPALSCDKRVTDVSFEWRNCRFRLDTQCDFLRVTQLWVTQYLGPTRSEAEIDYRRRFADYADEDGAVNMAVMLDDITHFTDIVSFIEKDSDDVRCLA